MRTGIHVICRDDTGVTILASDRFESRAWKTATKTANAAEYLALHQRQGEHSYRQGRIVSFRQDAKHPDRYVFVCESEATSLPWPGPTRGGPTMVINRGRSRP
jgi:hypothetical protein